MGPAAAQTTPRSSTPRSTRRREVCGPLSAGVSCCGRGGGGVIERVARVSSGARAYRVSVSGFSPTATTCTRADVRRARGRTAARAALAFVTGACALGASASLACAAQTAAIRVNQIGYAEAAPKRAYLMSHRSETGATFALLREPSSEVVMQGRVGQAVGRWSGRFAHVYALDFDAVRAAGSYRITVAGKSPALSPPFAIAPGETLYTRALDNSLSFYENERDGPQYIPSALRSAPAHLNDAHAMTYSTPNVNENGNFNGELTSLGTTIDASGGWWDAGDYLKFVQTTSYVVDLQLIGVRDFAAQLGVSAGASDFAAEAQFGLEWLLRMWNDESRTLYYQVGIGAGNSNTASDHDIWRLPQQDDEYGGGDPQYRFIRHRPVFRAGPPGAPVSPNLAGRDAAAFALCFQLLWQSQPSLAARCLLAGEHIFELADTDPSGPLLTAIPFSFYPETEWRDDLELAGTELADALASGAPLPAGLPHTEALYYLRQAASWARQYISHSTGEEEALNLYDVSGLAHYELVRALRQEGQPPALAVSEADLLADLRARLDAAVSQSDRDPFGLGYEWSGSDTVSHGDGLSVMASEYDALTGEPRYAPFAQRWLANMLGANAWGASFIIGDGSTFPHCPQHQVANIVGSLDGSPPVLAGAVVEGPTERASRGSLPGMRPCPPDAKDAFARFNGAGAVYRDNVQSFSTNEPAIDLTASSLLAFAWQEDPAPPQPLAASW
jgi:endoglucanase